MLYALLVEVPQEQIREAQGEIREEREKRERLHKFEKDQDTRF
jgi:hypothetical protein